MLSPNSHTSRESWSKQLYQGQQSTSNIHTTPMGSEATILVVWLYTTGTVKSPVHANVMGRKYVL